ncbi:hypothetical protein F5Y17DRAFT_135179 [Xylariaceae sp. FL0594]|nr:hypothetical protein F5Y17DRAFT_135179 [Xylariaceae sp. FL0594]
MFMCKLPFILSTLILVLTHGWVPDNNQSATGTPVCSSLDEDIIEYHKPNRGSRELPDKERQDHRTVYSRVYMACGFVLLGHHSSWPLYQWRRRQCNQGFGPGLSATHVRGSTDDINKISRTTVVVEHGLGQTTKTNNSGNAAAAAVTG